MTDTGLRHLRFLIVDESMYMRRIVRTMLHGFGALEIKEAEDGVRGLEFFIQYGPDVIITELVLPLIDGIRLIRTIRSSQQRGNSQTPVIALTAHATMVKVLAARDAGVSGLLVKPISAKELYLRVLNIFKSSMHLV